MGRPDFPVWGVFLWSANRLPAELPGLGTGEGLFAAGPAAKDCTADPPDLHLPSVLWGQAVRGVCGGACGGHSSRQYHHHHLPGVGQKEPAGQKSAGRLKAGRGRTAAARFRQP